MHVLVMAKAPVPGRVKTRLCPPCDLVEAAVLAEASLADTCDAVARSGAARRVVALDGEPGDWLPPGFEVVRQRGRSLDERLANAWVDTGGPGIQIGMDTPQVTPAALDEALELLGAGSRTAVLGPALDGGWWAIGLERPDPRVFLGIPMSTPHTGVAQRRRLRALGHRVAELSSLRDVDRIEDAVAVARVAPASRFRGRHGAPGRCGERRMRTVLRHDDGSTVPLAPGRWRAQPTPEEDHVLHQVVGPALDVGCGPGRHVLALARMGVPALGIDISPLAVSIARGRGADVLQRCVFRPLPLQGAWRTVLLLDGNIGIGGCPSMLLRRTGQLLAHGGRVLVEVDPPGTPTGEMRVRVEHGSARGPWFAWARVAATRLPRIAETAGLAVSAVWESGGRWFARLDRHPVGGDRGHDRRRHGDVRAGRGSGLGADAWALALAEGA